MLIFAVLSTWVCRDFYWNKGSANLHSFHHIFPMPQNCISEPDSDCTCDSSCCQGAHCSWATYKHGSYKRHPLFPILLWNNQQWSLSGIGKLPKLLITESLLLPSDKIILSHLEVFPALKEPGIWVALWCTSSLKAQPARLHPRRGFYNTSSYPHIQRSFQSHLENPITIFW